MQSIKRGVYQGIKTTVIEDTQQMMSSTSLWFAQGYALDKPETQGLSHFFEHLWAGGDDEYTKAKTLEEYGISSNAYTAAYTTYYYHVQEPIHLHKSLELLLDTFNQKLVSHKTFDREKQIIIQEKKDTQQELQRILATNLYNGSALAQDVYGNVENISYEQYINYAQLQYTKEKAHLIIITPNASNIPLEPHNASEYLLSRCTPLSKITPQNILIPTPDDTLEVVVGFALPGMFQSTDHYPLSLLRTVLGNFWTSVLIQELRIKKGLVYWVDTYNTSYPNIRSLSIQYKIDKNSLVESLKSITSILNNLPQYITPQDIERYKTMLISDSKVYYSNIYTLTEFYGSSLLYPEGIVSTPKAFYNGVKRPSYNDIIDLAQQFSSSIIKSLIIKGTLSSDEWITAQNIVRYIKP